VTGVAVTVGTRLVARAVPDSGGVIMASDQASAPAPENGSLKERIVADMKAAMKARAAERLSAIRMLLAAIKQKEVDERIQVDDAAAVAIIEKLIKQRKDSIAQFQAAGRQDLVEKESAELALLTAYLPQQFSAGELAGAVDAAVAEIAAAGVLGAAAMGRIMALLKPRLAGRADMTQVSALVRQRLAR
jgi:uncharacterized protein